MRYQVITNSASRSARLEAFVGNMRLDRNGRGEALARVIAQGTIDRAQAKRAPDGSIWERNAPATIRKKGRDDPGVDTGSMLDPRNLTGTPQIDKNSVTVQYAGSADDRRKLEYFETATAIKPARQVWGLDNTIRAQLAAEFRRITKGR